MNPEKTEQPFDFPERRKHKRFSFPFLVKCRLKGESVFHTALFNNISVKGLLLLHSLGFDAEEILDISFSFLEENHLTRVNLDGCIIWNKKNDVSSNSLDWRMGISFVSSFPDQEHTLKHFIGLYCQKELSEGMDFKVPVQARDFFIRGIKTFENKPADALMDFNQVIEMNPNHSAAYCYRAYLKDRLGDRQGASEDFDRAHKLGGI